MITGTQLLITGGEEPERTRDDIYTPSQLARAVVELVVRPHHRHVLEPHVGGGAFLDALDAWAPGTLTTAMDTDPRVRGLLKADIAHPGADFLDPEALADSEPVSLVLGNPPFSNACEHVIRALQVAPAVAFLLPLEYAGSRVLAPAIALGGLPVLVPVHPRPWTGSREVALYYWHRASTGHVMPGGLGQWRQLQWK